MEKREMREAHRWVLMHYLITVMGILIVSGFLTFVYATRGLEGLVRFKIGSVIFHFDSMLVILIAGVIGFAPSMVCFALIFLATIIIDIGRAYTVFVYLIAAIISFFAVRKRWYSQDVRSMCLLSTLLAFILGDIQMTLASLASGQGLTGITPKNILNFFLGELPECSIAVFITYLFLIKAPDSLRGLTFTGRLYIPNLNDKDIFSQIRTSRLSRFVMGLIAIEGIVLGVAASAFANALLPSIGEDAFSDREGSFFEDILDLNNNEWDPSEDLDYLIDMYSSDEDESDSGGESDTENPSVGASINKADSNTNNDGQDVSGNTKRHLEHRRFVLNRAGVAFDIKLIMLLLNTAIPFIVLSNVLAQRWIVFPIIRMSESINEFCDVPQEDKESRLKKIQSLPILNHDEIGDLYLALNQMATNIVHFVDEEREKEKLAADLRIAQKTSENKSNFLSNVSHELRTPINAVLGLDEMILRESSEEEILAYALDIQNAGKSLLGLVNDILDSSKLEEGKMELIPTEYELSSMINDLINMISVKAEEKHLKLDICVDEETPHILYGDEIRLKQVILNILTNAVKYTEQGSVTMTVGYEKLNDEYINLNVDIKDTGIGIKEEDIEKLFSRFERIEEGRNKNIEGTGLGMSIVRALLALMDSELEVKSVYGEGSDFSFSVGQKVVKWQPIGNFAEAYQKFKDGNLRYEAKYVAPEARILVVDDTPMNLTVVKGLLKETLVGVETADSGAKALDLVKKNNYDIIFMDQRMPEMDGVETFHEMEQLTQEGANRSSDAVVIMLTANAVSGSREQFLKEGFADYLSKPIDSTKLERMVQQYLPQEKLHSPEEYSAEEYSAEATAESASGLTEGAEPVGEYAAERAGEEKAPEESALVNALRGLASIDYETGLQNCGSEDLLIEVLKDFLEAIPGKSADIRRYFEEEDYKNYTILVHALKSSSRIIGAMQLSADAAYLEQCGDAAQQGDEEAKREISEKTAPLLKLYRSYYDKLTPMLENEEDADLRPEIPREELKEAMGAIREFVEAFDFDSADGVMDMLKDYRMPEDFADAFDQIKQSLSAVDRDALLKLLSAA
ncbi:MAG: response regulator [Lachnospiraceae bacterium]|nr:response regulator [Lachnospiraceae bacterium]